MMKVGLTLGLICLVTASVRAADAGAAAGVDVAVFDLRAQGDRAAAEQNYAIARKFYGEYLRRAYSKDVIVDAALRLAPCAVAMGDTQAAIDLIHTVPARVHKLEPTDPRAAVAVPNAYRLTATDKANLLYWEARALSAGNDPTAATHAFQQLLDMAPEATLQAKAALGLGQCAVATEEWAAAAAAYARVAALDVDPTLKHEASLGEIRALIAQKRYIEAEAVTSAYLKEAVGIYRYRLGIHYISAALALDKVSDAFAFFQENPADQGQLLSAPENYPILRQLGLALNRVGAPESARTVFEKLYAVVRTDARKKELLVDLAETAAAAGNPQAAIDRLSTYIRLYTKDPRLPELRFRIAQLLVGMGRIEDAIPLFRGVLANTVAPVRLRYDAAMSLGHLYREHAAAANDRLDKAISGYYEGSRLPVDDELRATALHAAAEIYFVDKSDYNNAAIFYEECADSYPKTRLAADSRFKEGVVRYRGKRYELAAAAFTRFIADFPDAPRRPQARFNRGLAEQASRNYPAAAATFEAYARDYADLDDAPLALQHASLAAFMLDRHSHAIDLLTTVIQRYAQSKHYPYALYRRAFLLLSVARYDDALDDCYTFLRKFADSSPENRERAADINLWLGDYFANHQDYEAAARFFLKLVELYPNSSDAPTALYEAAKNAFKRARARQNDQQGLAEAQKHIQRLLDRYPDAPDRVKAQACYLRGDINTIAGDFAAAAGWFRKCADLVPRTDLYYAALGRLGECYYSMGEGTEDGADQHDAALQQFRAIIDGPNVPKALVEMARYRAAKIYEQKQQFEQARDEYYHIVYAYDLAASRAKLVDWYYFSRAGFDLARLYEAAEQYMAAVEIYERLASAGIPVAEHARRRARELREEFLK